MKRYLFLIFILLFCNALFAQSGYQDYLFGMDIDTIKAKVEIRTRFYYEKTVFFMMFHFYNAEIKNGTIPNPLGVEGNDFEVYETVTELGTGDLTLLFSNKKLVGVVTQFSRFSNMDILTELRNKYGNGSGYTISGDEGIVWLDAQRSRFIIYESHNENDWVYNYKRVTYIEANWIRDICNRRMVLYREEIKRSKSRLD